LLRRAEALAVARRARGPVRQVLDQTDQRDARSSLLRGADDALEVLAIQLVAPSDLLVARIASSAAAIAHHGEHLLELVLLVADQLLQHRARIRALRLAQPREHAEQPRGGDSLPDAKQPRRHLEAAPVVAALRPLIVTAGDDQQVGLVARDLRGHEQDPTRPVPRHRGVHDLDRQIRQRRSETSRDASRAGTTR
jgi:hypothetical protein